MTNNFSRHLPLRITLRNHAPLLAQFLIYLFLFHVPFTLIFRPEWGGMQGVSFILTTTLAYFPFIFWVQYFYLKKTNEYSVTRNRSILFSSLVGVHWLVMMFYWAHPPSFVTLNELVVVTCIYCFPWAAFAWITAKLVWKFFQVPSTPRRRLIVMVIIPFICALDWLVISFYTVYFSMALRG